MPGAWDHTFRSSIPGSSLAYRHGSMPHSRPPKYVKPNDALEFIWKQLHQKKMLHTIWYYFENGGTVWAMAKTLLYKLTTEGIIQMNLAVIIYPVVANMLFTLSKKKGISPKLNPKFKNATKDTMINKHITDKIGSQHSNLPKSALANTHVSADAITKDMENARKLSAAKTAPTTPSGPKGLLSIQGVK